MHGLVLVDHGSQKNQEGCKNLLDQHRRRNQGCPQYFTTKTLLTFIHAAQIAIYYVPPPPNHPQMKLFPTSMTSGNKVLDTFSVRHSLVYAMLT